MTLLFAQFQVGFSAYLLIPCLLFHLGLCLAYYILQENVISDAKHIEQPSEQLIYLWDMSPEVLLLMAILHLYLVKPG